MVFLDVVNFIVTTFFFYFYWGTTRLILLFTKAYVEVVWLLLSFLQSFLSYNWILICQIYETFEVLEAYFFKFIIFWWLPIRLLLLLRCFEFYVIFRSRICPKTWWLTWPQILSHLTLYLSLSACQFLGVWWLHIPWIRIENSLR